MNARWWIECSAGQVNVVLCIKVDKRNKRMQNLEIRSKTTSHTRNTPNTEPDLVGDIIVDRSVSPPQTQGIPLILEFQKVFDHP